MANGMFSMATRIFCGGLTKKKEKISVSVLDNKYKVGQEVYQIDGAAITKKYVLAIGSDDGEIRYKVDSDPGAAGNSYSYFYTKEIDLADSYEAAYEELCRRVGMLKNTESTKG